MDIGLLDQDALSSPSTFLPNLEIMKLSTYYKKNKNYVSFILDPNKIERYNKVVLRKDINDGEYLSELFLEDKCEYGGLAFTNGIYVPLEEEIENSIPDISIYSSYFKRILIGKKKYEDLQRKLLKSSFIRLSSNGKTCNLDSSKGFIGEGARIENTIYIYDIGIFNIENASEAISDIVLGKKQKAKIVHPQYCNNFSEIEKWCREKWSHTENRFIYDNVILNKELKEICDKSPEFTCKPVILMCNDKSGTYTDNFLKTDFRNSLNRIIYVMTEKAKVKFECKQEPKDKNFKMLYRNLILWSNGGFGKFTFREYLFGKGQKKTTIFLDSLAENDAALRELISIAPQKIYSKGGKWLL